MPPLPATPPASDEATRRAMQANRSVDTRPEVKLRRRRFAAGRRFRKDYRVSVGGESARADVVFPRRRVAVFMDGCYWHGCGDHCRLPPRNREYWSAKIARNKERDERVSRALRDGGWTVIRVWEHEPVEEAVARIATMLAEKARRCRR